MLTQLTTVKDRLGIAAHDLADDALLDRFIAFATDLFERHCHRQFARTVGHQEEIFADFRELRADRYPVESVTSFELMSDQASGWVAQTDVTYQISPNRAVISLGAALGSNEEKVRVTYTGGYVLPGTSPGAGQTTLPSSIENAAIEQIAYWFQNRNRLGLVSISGEGGSIQQFAQLKLLPISEFALKPFRRFLM